MSNHNTIKSLGTGTIKGTILPIQHNADKADPELPVLLNNNQVGSPGVAVLALDQSTDLLYNGGVFTVRVTGYIAGADVDNVGGLTFSLYVIPASVIAAGLDPLSTSGWIPLSGGGASGGLIYLEQPFQFSPVSNNLVTPYGQLDGQASSWISGCTTVAELTSIQDLNFALTSMWGHTSPLVSAEVTAYITEFSIEQV